MEEQCYRVVFLNQSSVYEIYAHEVLTSQWLGFVTVKGLIFGNQTALVVDPAEEKLKAEFEGVQAFSIPQQYVVRIDQVEKKGQVKIRDATGQGNVTPFPHTYTPAQDK